jgi:hypothetical protein
MTRPIPPEAPVSSAVDPARSRARTLAQTSGGNWLSCHHEGVPPIAHAGHLITTIAYFLPVVAFLVWLVVTQIRDRRRRS